MIILVGDSLAWNRKQKEMSNFWTKKVVEVALEIWVVDAYAKVFETVFHWETKWFFAKWLLTWGGH